MLQEPSSSDSIIVTLYNKESRKDVFIGNVAIKLPNYSMFAPLEVIRFDKGIANVLLCVVDCPSSYQACHELRPQQIKRHKSSSAIPTPSSITSSSSNIIFPPPSSSGSNANSLVASTSNATQVSSPAERDHLSFVGNGDLKIRIIYQVASFFFFLCSNGSAF